MSITVFPLSPKAIGAKETSRQTTLMRQRIAAGIAHVNVGNVAQGAVGFQITPIYPTSAQLGDGLPHPSFSAQLLELGLKHNVEGLIQKANEQLSYEGAYQPSAQHSATRQYERVQDNFASGDIHIIARDY